MYFIIKYDTCNGGGIAFCSNEIDEKTALEYVKKSIHHNYEVENCEIIGSCSNLNTQELDEISSYSYYNEITYRYDSVKLKTPVYYYGGDCC